MVTSEFYNQLFSLLQMKKRISLLLYFLTFTSFLAAQNKDIEDLQQKIADTHGSKPDSAKIYLLKILNYTGQLSDSAIVRVYGRLGTTYGQLGSMDSARYYFNKGDTFAGSYPKLRGDLHKQLALSERNMSNYDNAFEATDKAEKYYREANYMVGVGMAYVERASSYNYMAKEKKAIEWLEKAIALFDQIGETKNKVYALQELANCYTNAGEFEFGIEIYEKILPDVKRETATLNYYFTMVNYAYALSSIEKYDKAEEVYKITLDFFKETRNETFRDYVLYKLGHIYKEKGNLGRSLYYIEKAFEGMVSTTSHYLKECAITYLDLLVESKDMARASEVVQKVEELINNGNKLQFNDLTQVVLLRSMKNYYAQNGNYEKALELIEEAVRLNDSIELKRNELELKKVQEKYQNEYRRKENEILATNNQLLEAKNNDKITIIGLISTMGMVVLIGGIIVYRKQRKEVNLKAKSLESLQEAKRYLNEKLETEAILNKERRETLEKSERELVANSMKVANLKNEINAVIASYPSSKDARLLKNKLQSILKDDNDWEYFYNKFVNVHPDFISKLKQHHPSLTTNDIDFCALVKLRLSNKEIANLLNIDHKSVISKKYRLRKKMLIQENESLEVVLDHI